MEVLGWEFTREVKFRNLFCIASCSFSQEWGVHNNSLKNLGRALHERVFKVQGRNGLQDPPRPAEDAFERRDSFLTAWTNVLEPCRQYSHQDVVKGYSGRKAKRYSNACESIMEFPVVEQDSHLTAFLKAEKTNLSAKADPAPRLIQFPNPKYSLDLMTYLKFNEKAFMKAIDDVWGEPTVMSGYHCERLGEIMAMKWNTLVDPIAVPLDFSRFDQHTSAAALRYEFGFYEAAFPGDEHLRWLLSLQLHPKGIAVASDGAIRYHCPQGGRGSGQINTSMGNKLIVCGLMWEFFREIGLEASLANMGDDCVIFLNRKDEKKLSENLTKWWLNCGYNAVVESTCYELEDIEFCQSKPVCVNGRYVMVRSPNKAMTKDCITLQSSETVSQIAAAYMAISTCGRIINSGVPISFALHDCLFRAARLYAKPVELTEEFIFKCVEFGNYERMKGLEYKRKFISDSTRLSYFKAFGITPDVQIAIENYYQTHDVNLGGEVDNVNSIELHTALPSLLLDSLFTL